MRVKQVRVELARVPADLDPVLCKIRAGEGSEVWIWFLRTNDARARHIEAGGDESLEIFKLDLCPAARPSFAFETTSLVLSFAVLISEANSVANIPVRPRPFDDVSLPRTPSCPPALR
jgi:hypothetical protein